MTAISYFPIVPFSVVVLSISSQRASVASCGYVLSKPILVTLMMEALSSPETSALKTATRRNILQGLGYIVLEIITADRIPCKFLFVPCRVIAKEICNFWPNFRRNLTGI
jgi:hypothetical protein